MTMTRIALVDLSGVSAPGKYNGFIYVIEFTGGVVKIGMTTNPVGRITSHAHNARSFGLDVEQIWISPEHCEYQENERRLLASASLIAEPMHGREFFRGVSSEVVLKMANALSFEPITPEELDTRTAEADARMSAITDWTRQTVAEIHRREQMTQEMSLIDWLRRDLSAVVGKFGVFEKPNMPIGDEAMKILDESPTRGGIGEHYDTVALTFGLVRNVLSILEVEARHPHVRDEATS